MLGCCVILMQSLFLVMYKAMYVDVIIITKWNTLSNAMLNSVIFLSISRVFQNTLFKVQNPDLQLKVRRSHTIHKVSIFEGRVYFFICKTWTWNIYSTFSLLILRLLTFEFCLSLLANRAAPTYTQITASVSVMWFGSDRIWMCSSSRSVCTIL